MHMKTTLLSLDRSVDGASRVTSNEHAAKEPTALEFPAKGSLVDEKFRLERVIGVGGMAHVMLAHDVSLDRPVALKFLGRSLLEDALWRERFVIEAKNMARVRHPNVMPIHSFGVHQGWPYFVMDYVEGVTLSQWLHDRPRPAVAEVVALVRQVADALDAIHAVGLVHHDVKPANVLVDEAGRALLIDLGISRLGSLASPRMDCVGTPRYMAPEQTVPFLHSASSAMRADIYQLGVTTFELLAGIVPFDDESIEQVVERHRTERPPAPSSVRPGLPHAMDAAVLQALAKAPQDRWSSAGAFAKALEDAIAHGPGGREDAGRGARPLNVLVAEDDAGQRDATCALLEAELPPGSRVLPVADGVCALEASEREAFDVVVLDLHMPWMGGLEVARAIARAPGRRPAVIALTAMGGSEDWQALREVGVEALVLKPFEAGDLAALIERHAARYDARPPTPRPR